MIAALLGLVLLGRMVQVRVVRRRAVRTRAEAIPDLVDLFAIAAAAGHPPWSCVQLIAGRAPAPCRDAMGRAARQLTGGASLDAVLADLADDLGFDAVPLTEALLGAAASGGSLLGVLERVVASARLARRRAAEQRARRLPVVLLFPLVCCTLPAFLLLAVAPLLLGLGAPGR